jgi:CBS domain containing-hemolysin-like protein
LIPGKGVLLLGALLGAAGRVMSPTLQLLFALLLVLLNGFFVAAEFAMVKVRSTRIEELVQQGSLPARVVQRAMQRLDGYLSATQIGITIASLGLGSVGEPAFARIIEPFFARLGPLSHSAATGTAVAVAFIVITFLHIVFGELAPKWLAIQRPEGVALGVSLPLDICYRLFYPAITPLRLSATAVLRLFGIRTSSVQELGHSEEEIRMILTGSHQSGYIKDSELDLVQHVFEFADKEARDIMVPRVDMAYLSTAWPLEKNLEVVNRHGFTRYPLCEGDADHVIGMVHVKDLLLLREDPQPDIRRIMRGILMVPETKSIDQLLREFQYRKMHMAVVLDEYGGTAGLVTLEDVLEEIVGEIQDEFEQEEPEIQKLDENTFIVQGKASLSDLREDIDLDLPPNGADTIGGFVQDALGTIPSPGATLQADGFRIEVLAMEGQRIRKLRLMRQTPPPEELTAE